MSEIILSSRTDIKETLGSTGSEGLTGRQLDIESMEGFTSEAKEVSSAYQEWIQAPARMVIVASISYGEVVKGVYVRTPTLDEPLLDTELANEFEMLDDASNDDYWAFEEGLE